MRCAPRLLATVADALAGVNLPGAPRFLLVRLDGLGDALACVPLLEGLRRVHPGASFGAVCSRANASVFSTAVLTVHVVPGKDATSVFAAELAARDYTHALVATEEVVGYELARASRARRRSGFWHRFEKPFKSLWQRAQLTDPVYRPARWTARPEHEAEALNRLAIPFGAATEPPADAQSLRRWLAIEGADSADTTLGFQIAGKLTSGGWGPAMLARACATALNASMSNGAVLLAASDDQGLARSLLEHLPAGMRGRMRLLPPLSVPQWFGAIASMSALVTPDTGAAHAAGMLGVPVVDLFDRNRFDQLSRQWRPWAAPHRCLVKPEAHSAEAYEFGDDIGAALRGLLRRGALS